MEQLPPTTLYKYLDLIGGFKTLENCNLKFTPPNAFNDPFEFMPKGYEIKDQDAFRDMVKKLLTSILDRDPRMDLPKWIIASGTIHNAQTMDKYANSIVYDLNNEDRKIFVKLISQNILCTCFAEQRDNLLMWAHYADMHKGIVLEFSTKYLSNLHKVEYTTERVTIPWTENKESPHYKQAIELLKTTKSTDWAYEKEWRSIRRKDEAEQKGNFYFFPFSHQAVVSVILGAQFPETEKEKEKIKKLLYSFPNCKLYQAKLHQSQFKLEFENIL